MAETLGAFFAYSHHEKAKVDLGGRHWEGLPADPVWLAWLGAAYREAAGTGPLIRAADRPDDFEAIKRAPVPWPAELVRPAAVIPELRP